MFAKKMNAARESARKVLAMLNRALGGKSRKPSAVLNTDKRTG